ncbi:MAG: hypothetical protein LBF01_02325, partial [Bacteroidales bacterium]|nr:hypothetical protein [Bacteroidales bacterium]
NYKIEDNFNAKGLREASKRLKYNELSESEQRAYDRKVHYERVRMSEEETSFLSGKKEGIKKGKKEGIKEGIKKGLKKGLKEGMIKIAKKMLSNGASIEDISVLTDLTLTELSELSEQLSKSKTC